MLIFVYPDHVANHNPAELLEVLMTFNKPIDDPIDIAELFYLENDLRSKIIPAATGLSRQSPTKMKIVFEPNQLKHSTCYDLKMDTKSKLKLISDDLKHTYCTAGCNCNPKSNAICDDNLKCICPDPFAGQLCYECIKGYNAENGLCIKIHQSEENPKIKNISINVGNLIHRDNEVKITVEFTDLPRDIDGSKISALKRNKVMIDTFVLEKVNGNSIIKPNTAYPVDDDLMKWKIEFEPDDFIPGNSYQLKVNRGNLYDKSRREFIIASELPKFEVEKHIESHDKIVECGKHGELVKNKCICDEGYSGTKCEDCAHGYERFDADNCEKIKTPEIIEIDPKTQFDEKARVVAMTPNGENIIDKLNPRVVIDLAVPAYTKEGLIIDKLTNSLIMADAFVLQKYQSQKIIRAETAIPLDKKGIRWEIEFNKNELQIETDYVFMQVKGVLFTKEGKMFSAPDLEPPTFKLSSKSIIKSTECSNHGLLINGLCVCDNGYIGKKCSECDADYEKMDDLCVKHKKTSINIMSEKSESHWAYIYYVFYISIGILAIYLLSGLRGPKKPTEYEPVEMKTKKSKKSKLKIPEDEDIIDLHSTKFDSYKHKPDN